MKKPSLMSTAQRLCTVVGVLWLIALVLLVPFHLPQIGKWFFIAGAVVAIVLLVMLFLQHRRER